MVKFEWSCCSLVLQETQTVQRQILGYVFYKNLNKIIILPGESYFIQGIAGEDYFKSSAGEKQNRKNQNQTNKQKNPQQLLKWLIYILEGEKYFLQLDCEG